MASVEGEGAVGCEGHTCTGEGGVVVAVKARAVVGSRSRAGLEAQQAQGVGRRGPREVGHAHAPKPGDPGPGEGDPAGLVRLPTERVRAQVRAVGLDEKAVDGDARGRLAERVELLAAERDHAREREVQAQVEERLRLATTTLARQVILLGAASFATTVVMHWEKRQRRAARQGHKAIATLKKQRRR